LLKRATPRGKPIAPDLARGDASRARVRVAIEHVFAARKCRVGLVICSVGLARLGLPTLITNMICLAWCVTPAASV
jgi:IS5 family transposase